MKSVNNQLDKSFGPVGSWAGYFLIIGGIAAAFSSAFGIIPIATGAFLGFTSTSAEIDLEAKRIRFNENLFGIIPMGKWIQLLPEMKIGIKESKITWTAFSRSNRTMDVDQKDFRLILFDAEGNEIMTLKKTDSLEKAIIESKSLCAKLGLTEFE